MGMLKKENDNLRSNLHIPLLRSYIKREKQAEEQKVLKEKYDIFDKDLLVVEKRNPVAQILKVVFQACFTAIRIITSVALVILATIGLTSIIYPNIREQLTITIFTIYEEVKFFLNLSP